MSAFARDAEQVFHTYSVYAPGMDALWAVYQWLDRAPKGRNEARDDAGWMRRHDEYTPGLIRSADVRLAQPPAAVRLRAVRRA